MSGGGDWNDNGTADHFLGIELRPATRPPRILGSRLFRGRFSSEYRYFVAHVRSSLWPGDSHASLLPAICSVNVVLE